MVKHRSTRRRGGAWYNPLTWFSSTPAPVPTTETPPAVAPTPPTTAATSAYGGKKKSKTRRSKGGRRKHSAKQIYGH